MPRKEVRDGGSKTDKYDLEGKKKKKAREENVHLLVIYQ